MFASARSLAIVLSAILLSLLLAAGSGAEPPPARLWTEKPTTQALDPDAPVSMRAFSVLAKELSPAVINISVTKARASGPQMLPPFFGMPFPPGGGGQSVGSGVIINQDGYALTNHHVIEDASEIRVRLKNGVEYPAKVVGSHPQLDVALLKIDVPGRVTVAALGDSEVLEIGEWVIAIGNPFGLNHTVTAGIVSAKGRRDVHPGSRPTYANFIQTDASINPGNSGGPLINIRGEVVGINTAINAAGQGIGFAVPINMIKKVLPQLAHGRVERSYLGVKIGPVSRELAAKLGIQQTTGALVNEVQPRTPAAAAGVEAGDVITHWEGKPVEHWEDLPWLASTAGAGKEVKILVRRRSSDIELTVRLTSYPGEKQASGPAKAAKPKGTAISDLGLTVAPLPKKLAAELSVSVAGGVVVTGVDRGSIASHGGLKPNDAILQVNYEPIRGGVAGFKKKMASLGDDEVLTFLVHRGELQIFLVFSK